MLMIGGCDIIFEYKKTKRLSTNFEPNGLFVLETHNGSIKLIGEDKNQCEVIATVRVKALTEEEAQQLAAEVKVGLELDGKRLAVKIEKPELSDGRSINIDFDVTIPTQTTLELACHSGTIYVSNIADDINGTTHNGSIYAKKISGKKVKLKTHNGAIEIYYVKSFDGKLDLSAETHNGNICVNAPSDLSTKIAISTNNGSVSSNIPMTITNNMKTVLQGIVGKGNGVIDLRTHNGSIKINRS